MLKCQFCQSPLKKEEYEWATYYGTQQFFCIHCQAEYIRWNDGESNSIGFYVNIGNKKYKWISYGGDRAYLWLIENEPRNKDNVWSKFKTKETIKHWNGNAPNVNPTNVKKKIVLCLTFL